MTVSLTFFKQPFPETNGFGDSSFLAWVSIPLVQSIKFTVQNLSNEKLFACTV